MNLITRWRRVRGVRVLCVLALLFAACEGDDGDEGSDGSAGYSCWDLNQNGIRDLPAEDANGDGAVDALDCQGDDGDDGDDGLSCWDINRNGHPDPEVEDRNRDGTVDLFDCQGGDGEDGQSCWDLNANGQPDLPAEDSNGDGTVDALDCQGGDGEDGEDGQSCWDLNANGQPDLPAEDANGDGTVDALDCQGGDGEDGEDGQSCWDLNANGQPDLPAEDANADGVVDVADCAGISTGSLAVEVTDAASDALLAAGEQGFMPALVALYPPVSAPVETDEFGRVFFPRLPAGVYTVTASARSLVLDGTTVSESAFDVSSPPLTRSIVAGSSNFMRLRIARLPQNLPLTALHDASWSAGAAYTKSNCTTCHGSKLNELSMADDVPRWHSIANARGNAVHASADCTFCHSRRVDLLEDSVASIRKQVAISTCIACHPSYPLLP